MRFRDSELWPVYFLGGNLRGTTERASDRAPFYVGMLCDDSGVADQYIVTCGCGVDGDNLDSINASNWESEQRSRTCLGIQLNLGKMIVADTARFGSTSDDMLGLFSLNLV